MAHAINKARSKRSRSLLPQWIANHGEKLNLSIRGRVRGHSLHLLCELKNSSDNYPCQQEVSDYFRSVVDYAEVNQLAGTNAPRIRHIWLYGRIKGAQHPAWTESILIAPLSYIQDMSSFRQGVDAKIEENTASSLVPAYAVSNVTSSYSFATSGGMRTIAYSVYEILINFGIDAKVRVKRQSDRPNTSKDRLWIFCRGPYSPAARLIGEPIARQLRALSLSNIDDALLQFQVAGEDQPDWILRIDLTPQDEMLKDLARWGDVEAITRLVNQVLHPLQGQVVEANLKDITLHLSCTPSSTPQLVTSSASSLSDASEPLVSSPEEQGDIWQSDSITMALADLLKGLAPQGIHSAVIYGQESNSTQPDWVEWLDLPAKTQLDRGVAPVELVANGDTEAIAFLIQRILNPDLNVQLATGGIRVQVLTKKQLIHVMCDGPRCPAKDEVVDKVETLLRSFDIAGIKGVRLYGRRAGQRHPRWLHEINFGPATTMVPEPPPQFAATAAYVTELVTPTSEPMLRPELTSTELWSRWRQWQQRMIASLRRSLLATQLVIPTADSPELMLRSTPCHATVKTAVVWGAVGILTLVHADLGLSQLAHFRDKAINNQYFGNRWLQKLFNGSSLATTPPSSRVNINADEEFRDDTLSERQKDEITLNQRPGSDVFDSDGFTALPESEASPAASPTLGSDIVERPSAENISIDNPLASGAAASLVSTLVNSPYPSFNSDQLDFKLALYYQRLLDIGPPDILVLGSSRALRGVDPVALERALSELGYRDVDVFNFGVNGATAQVVELIVQHILLPEQLPKLIIWADGARAFNSGRDDRTYDGISASEGYEQLLEGALVLPSVAIEEHSAPSTSVATGQSLTDLAQALTQSYDALDDRLSDTLAGISTAYEERDNIKTILQNGLTLMLPQIDSVSATQVSSANKPPSSLDLLAVPNAPLNNGNNDDNHLAQETQGHEQANLHSPASLSAIDHIDEDGFLPLQVRFDPSQYYTQYARVPGNYDKDYSNFQLIGSQNNALLTLLALGETYDIPIVFINMPLTEEYLDPFRAAHERTFRQHMLNLALQQENFVFRDLAELWFDQPDYRSYFSDPSHLNQYGAAQVPLHISRDPMIPWNITNR